MSHFTFNGFPRPPPWAYWNWHPSQMRPPPDPKPRPITPPKEQEKPFIPPRLTESEADREEEWYQRNLRREDEQEARRQQEKHEEEDHHQEEEEDHKPQEHHRRESEEHQHKADRERAARSKQEEVTHTHLLHKLKVYQYRRSKDVWKHMTTPGLRPSGMRDEEERRRFGRCTEVKIITWNVDMVTERREERLAEALQYIKHVVLDCKDNETEPEPCVIMLQEVWHELVPFLLENEWLRRWFMVTPHTPDKWPNRAKYGNVTLVSRLVRIAEAHILHFGNTRMERTALCVKIRLDVPDTEDTVVMSIVNTHLESMPIGAQARPKQLEMCARFLTLQGVAGGVVAGDLNAIGPEDATLPRAVGLKDSWRKGDDVEEGKTWGTQGQNQHNYPQGRLDKILFLRGTAGYKVDEPRRFAVGLKTRDEALWISDHSGLETTLRVLKTHRK